MNKEERSKLIEEIRNACIITNPNILDLKFGCKIEVGGMTRIINGINHDRDFYTLLDDTTFVVSKETMELSKAIKVIGRDIYLSDIIHAMGQADNNAVTVKNTKEGNVVSPKLTSLLTWWDFKAESLENQVDNAISFIHSIVI